MVAAAALALALLATPAAARGPDNIADVAEAVIDAVVNISTSQTVAAGGPGRTGPESRQGPGSRTRPGPDGRQGQLPPGSPFEEFFDEFFKNRRGQGDPKGGDRSPRRVNSLGLRFRHRRGRYRGHQQSRHRGCRRDHRDLQRRAPSSRQN